MGTGPITFSRPELYAFDAQTKEYRGPARAEISMPALAHDRIEFLIPAFTTEVKPPSVPKGSAAIWNDASWDVIADHRGETWWRGTTPVTIQDFSDPEAAGLTREKELPPEPPRDLRAEQRQDILRQLMEVASIGSSFTHMGKKIPQEWMDKHDAIVARLRAIDGEA